MNTTKEALKAMFDANGAYVLVDGQYGSTGKGVIAAYLADLVGRGFDGVLSNAGPNSGHTFYHGDTKVVLKQLPTFGVKATLNSPYRPMPIFLTAGAVIDPDLLLKETTRWTSNVVVHPHAAVITHLAKQADKAVVEQVAGTGQGVGPAIEHKIARRGNAVFGHTHALSGAEWASPWVRNWRSRRYFVEVSQGFSLGINSGFYPYTTSRECTVSQALADAGLPPNAFRKSILSLRTYPIRVGNTVNSSGPGYDDQREITWEHLGVEPEVTTVTNRVRRVFTFSVKQYMDALYANMPRVVFINFMNYVDASLQEMFVHENIVVPFRKVMGRDPYVLLGHGPRSADVTLWKG